MKTVKKLTVLALFATLFVSCNKDEGYSLGRFWVDIATVENPNRHPAFFFRLDDGTRMWTAATANLNYRPADGQRIIADFTKLNTMPPGSDFQHNVRLNAARNVLTKGIFAVTPETQDSIGNDPVRVENMWIGSDFLNIRFQFLGSNRVNYINLVSDASKDFGDGKIHLEFRRNANNDRPDFVRRGIVSFNLTSLQAQANGASELDLVIHVRESEDTVRTFNLTYRFADAGRALHSSERFSIEDLNAEIR